MDWAQYPGMHVPKHVNQSEQWVTFLYDLWGNSGSPLGSIAALFCPPPTFNYSCTDIGFIPQTPGADEYELRKFYMLHAVYMTLMSDLNIHLGRWAFWTFKKGGADGHFINCRGFSESPQPLQLSPVVNI